MSASVVEQILARVKEALIDATPAGANVERAREAPFGPDELPAINIRRAPSNNEPIGGASLRVNAGWTIEFCIQGAEWETQVDALHMQAHAVLASDPALAALGHGLRCMDTECQADEIEKVKGRLTARYQMQVVARSHDLTRAIT